MSQERFELPTHALEGRCSIQLSYWDIMIFLAVRYVIPYIVLSVRTFIIIVRYRHEVNTFSHSFLEERGEVISTSPLYINSAQIVSPI